MANLLIRYIPNTITCCNLISGCMATGYALYGDLYLSLTWIVLGAVFDFFDGMSARLLHVSSPIGKELDSLADDITFGFAPSAMIFTQLEALDYPDLMAPVQDYVPCVAFVMAAFSALRLAKFNLDERQTMGFIGLPTPANALFWGAFLIGCGSWIENLSWGYLLIWVMLGLSCWLLVAEIPMFALKFKHWGWQGNEVRYLFLATCVPLLCFGGITGLAVIIAWYVALSVIINYSHCKA